MKRQVVTEVVAPEAGATCDHAHHAPRAEPPPSAPAPAETTSSSGHSASDSALVSDEIRTVYLHPGVMDEFMAVAQVRLRAIITCSWLVAVWSAHQCHLNVSVLLRPVVLFDRQWRLMLMHVQQQTAQQQTAVNPAVQCGLYACRG